MNTNKKVLLIISIILIALAAATIINVGINFRKYAYKNVEEKAQMTAEIVRSALTSHMVNGTMDKRLFFLSSITRNKDIDDIWIVRSENVIKQFGQGLANELPHDQIDEDVLKSGKIMRQTIEHADKATFRITVPYNASSYSMPNCLTCHNAAEGETLGAISMTFDISEIRTSGALTLLKIFAINIVFLIITLFLANRYFKPYIELFDQLGVAISKAIKGNFSYKVDTKLKDEAGAVALQLNQFFEKMRSIFGGIHKELATLIPPSAKNSSNALDEASSIIHELSDMYKFKKTIELDSTKDDIYGRIIHILEKQFEVKSFVFSEVDRTDNKRITFYSSETITPNQMVCVENTSEAGSCRAYRTDSTVISSDFDNLCKSCSDCYDNYVCFVFHINSGNSILLSMFASDSEELDRLQKSVTSIKTYLEVSKPVLEGKILMQILKDSSLKDGLTGLYNRRFLDQFVEKAAPQALRSKNSYAVMMIDIDFFKMVNDSYGHDVGDDVIKALSKILKDSIRDSDLAIRFGGEEFMVLLFNATIPEGVIQVAQKIRNDFSKQKFSAGQTQFNKTLSIGTANFPDDSDSFWKVIKYADTALYEAKNSGRDKVVVFKQEMYQDEEF